ncbi:MAG: NAD(P)-binding domain-containing protein, partial [bacterium]|nr:NAD(P)-binding domain-containing protein [bacterium]
MKKIRRIFQNFLDSPNMASRRPVVDANFQSNVPGLYIIGDLAGAPVVKLAMKQGFEVANHIASTVGQKSSDPDVYDVIVVGSGASGLNAALGLQEKGLRVIVLEKNKIANTIEDFPEGKWVYAEPDSQLPKGKLWLDGAQKEDLLYRWHQIIRENQLEVHTEEGVRGVHKQKDGSFEVETDKTSYRARRVVLATGQRGNPRKLGVAGEDREQVYHRLYSPGHYTGEDILVVGGGNSAVEAALTLSKDNRVALSYRGAQLSRVFSDTERQLKEAVEAGRVDVIYNSKVKAFEESDALLDVNGAERRIRYHHAFVLVGAELPTGFLRSLGIRLENDWTGSLWSAAAWVLAALLGLWVAGGQTGIPSLDGLQIGGGLLAAAALGGLVVSGKHGSRFAWLGISFLICYTVYGAKQSPGHEFWPYKGWGYDLLSFLGRPWSFWYTVLYSVLMTFFGIQAMKRWGFDRKDRFQIWRYTSLLGFQWIFFFLIPEFLFRWAVEYQWVGQRLANDPTFTDQIWRSYGIIYAWPLFFYTFFGSPHAVWVVWGVLLSFVIIPVLVLFHGKRYCSWICGCGGLAETLGDRWRHLAPKGKGSVAWERMNLVVLAAAVVVTVMMVSRDVITIFRTPATVGLDWYHLIADVWLVGILPVTLYPFFGGKIWCRYWCPLAKMMNIFGALYTRFRVSRFAIHANDKCIACGECSRNCQVGIDVMGFALKREELNNR